MSWSVTCGSLRRVRRALQTGPSSRFGKVPPGSHHGKVCVHALEKGSEKDSEKGSEKDSEKGSEKDSAPIDSCTGAGGAGA